MVATRETNLPLSFDILKGFQIDALGLKWSVEHQSPVIGQESTNRIS